MRKIREEVVDYLNRNDRAGAAAYTLGGASAGGLPAAASLLDGSPDMVTVQGLLTAPLWGSLGLLAYLEKTDYESGNR